MGSEWKDVTLSDLGEVARGRSRHRPRYAEHLYGGDYPFIQTGDVKASGGRILSHTQTYSEAGLAQSRLWPAKTMCITIAANIAETGVLQYPACFPDSVIGFIADEQKADVYFIEYLFRQLRKDIQRQATGSVQDNINLQTLERLRFKVPPVEEQAKIASFLNLIEDKITLNRQINQTLEQMAQTLFKSWFVDFDPVMDNALDAGNPIPDELQHRAEARKAVRQGQAAASKEREGFKPLPDDVRQLFPDAFEESELGWVPNGWAYRDAESVASVSIGKTPPRKESHWFSENPSDNVTWVSIRDMGGYGAFTGRTSEYLTQDAVSKFNVKRVPKDSVLLSFKLTLGRVAIAHSELTTNEAIAHFVNPKFGLNKEFLYSYLSTFDYNRLGSTSSIATAVNSKIIKRMPILVPTESASSAFEYQVGHLFEKMKLIDSEVTTLTELRDTLLPKLISGELRLDDVEAVVEQETVSA